MRQRALELLRAAVGSAEADFRGGQWQAVEALLRRERLLVVQRTGWGKSIVYFLATRLLRDNGAGCTLLISPLLSLMRNQIQAASRIGVRAETINSTNEDEWAPVEAALRRGEVDVLLISPERLANEGFVSRCLLPIAGRIGLLVVDEAHCISDWGHDFRPDYRRIVRILQALPPNVPVLATTATANDRVMEDIQQQLGPTLAAIRGPLTRESLRLQNLRKPSRAARMAWIAHQVPILPGSGIIYTLTVHDSIVLAEWLQNCGIDAAAYYGRLENDERERLENQLLRNEVKALVATVALGMGFDKPDVGFVIHFQRPASVVHYYQQVGRAGRALENAYGVLLSGEEDDDIADYFMRTAFPTETEVQEVLTAIEQARGPVKTAALENQLNFTSSKLKQVVKFLLLESPSPIHRTPQGYVRTPVRWQMPLARIARIQDLRRREQQRMRQYVETRGCLMQFLSHELNDPKAASCGKCANCTAGLSEDYPAELAIAASAFLNNLDLPIEPRKKWPAGADFEGLRGVIQPEHRYEIGRALCRWGDPGYGELVRDGKRQSETFCDELVDAAARLMQRWNPRPSPAWVTCVPSRRNTDLVPSFARRLAQALHLPFIDCIAKVRDTAEQKTRQNSFQQCHNLEHAFAVDASRVQGSPVLLVDDMVDSRWTFTVLALKLKQAGSGPILPFALANTSAGDGH